MKAHKSNKRKLIIVIALIIVVGILTAVAMTIYGNKQGEKEKRIAYANESIAKLVHVVESLQTATKAYDDFIKSTDNQSAYSYTPGVGSLSFVDSVTSDDSSTWKKCEFNFNDRLNKAIDMEQEAIGKLSGEDKNLLESWAKEAKIISDWAMCYKGNLIINRLKAKNNTDDFKNVSLQIKGRISSLQGLINSKKKQLQELKAKNPIML